MSSRSQRCAIRNYKKPLEIASTAAYVEVVEELGFAATQEMADFSMSEWSNITSIIVT